ncbi:MAG: HNH endonuclease signature motif containing protein, partial [Dehalococcoidia bacterium]
NPICVMCGRPATDVDHIEPHCGDYDKFWDESNLSALCHSCHSRKTAREDGGFGRTARSKG